MFFRVGIRFNRSSMAITKLADYIPLVLRTESNPTTCLLALSFGQVPAKMVASPDLYEPLPKDFKYPARADYDNVALIRLQHAIEGMCTEAGELMEQWTRHRHDKLALDLTNVKEELGDAYWYLALALSAIGIDTPAFDESLLRAPAKGKKGYLVDHLAIFGLRMLDQVKKRKFYPRAIVQNDLLLNLHAFNQVLASLTKAFGLDPYQMMDANVAKLQARYKGDGLTVEEAINRNVIAEMMAMEFVDDAGDEAYVWLDSGKAYDGEVSPIDGVPLLPGAIRACEYLEMHPDAGLVWTNGLGFVGAIETANPDRKDQE